MKTLADLKRRLVPGVSVTLIDANFPHNFLNIKRQVIRQTSKEVVLEAPGDQESFLDWPKASQVHFLDKDTFKIDFGAADGNIILTYRIEESQQ